MADDELFCVAMLHPSRHCVFDCPRFPIPLFIDSGVPMKLVASFVLAAAAASLAMSAYAQFAKPEDAIKYRKSVMTLQSAHFGRIAAMASGKMPFDAAAVVENATILETVTRLPLAGFVAGSDKGETRAKPEIWTDTAKFKETGEKLNADAIKLLAAAKTGNIDNIKAAVGPVGGDCKSCHDNFRKD
ncbi:MAG: cytochrome c [Betaproteobacteria bacterium]